jgi:hypothetical protein
MGKTSNSEKQVLPEFQNFLLERRLVPEKNIPYLAHWVSRFLNFARKRELTITKSPLDALYGAQES